MARADLVAHVYRRLSMGPQPDLVASTRTPADAIARALDLSAPAATPAAFMPPTDFDAARDFTQILPVLAWWIGRMQDSPRLIEERLTWFWHDHFATGLQKVRVPYLMWQQHLTIRRNATGNFATLLREISRDPAMLVYLDGTTNSAQSRNENFGREVMELFTLGRGPYTEQDVVEVARASTGWVNHIPGRPGARGLDNPPWTSTFVPARFDSGPKTILGRTGNFDLDGALGVLLDHDATAEHIAGKLYRAIVGRRPSAATVRRLGARFRDSGYEILPLVEAIVDLPDFLAGASVGVKPRSPVEKLVGLVQAVPPPTGGLGAVGSGGRPSGVTGALRVLGYVPFAPPNVAGFPEGDALIGPHQLVHTMDLLSVYPRRPPVPPALDHLLARFALIDVSDRTRRVLSREPDPARRLALVLASPEYAVV